MQDNDITKAKQKHSKHIHGTIEQRFWPKVDKSPGHGPWGDCWIWTGSTVGKGYGKMTVTPGTQQSAHRVGYELQNGDIPDGLNVLHRCDTRLCVRGEHLFTGTLDDNNQDMVRKGRQYAKLNPQSICEIRQALAALETMQSIADRYGVSQSLISHIKHGRAWVNR